MAKLLTKHAAVRVLWLLCGWALGKLLFKGLLNWKVFGLDSSS